jgi:hypothetical protein
MISDCNPQVLSGKFLLPSLPPYHLSLPYLQAVLKDFVDFLEISSCLNYIINAKVIFCHSIFVCILFDFWSSCSLLAFASSSFKSLIENIVFCKHLCTVYGGRCSVGSSTQITASGTDMTSQVKWQKMRIPCRLLVTSCGVYGSSALHIL